jgi:hypothetical protein
MVSQTNIYLAFTLSLLCLSPMEVASATDAVPVRMNPMDFNEISLRESSTELSSMPAAKRSRMWRSKARQYFKAGNCEDKTQPCSLPYVFCDSTQGLSSNKRRDRLTDELLNRTPDNEIDLVEIDLLPFFFDEEQSCYTASMTPKIARKLANKSCESDEKTCIIHPLLPMMKLSQGTVESVTQSAELKVDQQISIYAGLSPYHTLSRDEISLQSLATEVIESGLEPENCENQLGDALPSTGSSLSCESQHSLNAAQIEVDWKHSTALFTIIPEDGDSPEILRQKVLRFMSGLASRSEFTSVQDATDSYYFD